MTDDHRPAARPSVRRNRPVKKRPGKKKRRVWPILLVIAIFAATTGWWWGWRDGTPVTEDYSDFVVGPAVEAPLAGDRAVVLVYPEWDASGFVTEERQIPSRDRPGEDLLSLLGILCEGPRISGAVSALPAGTRTLAAFFDPQDQSVVLDFSRELVIDHPGGSAAEVATLTSILRTVALNFPRTRRCVILVEGAQVETLAGHLDMVKPFDPRRWM
jgi:hypothetical protein